jgi:hypothetical protein
MESFLEAVAFQTYPVVGFSLSRTSTWLEAGITRILSSAELLTKTVAVPAAAAKTASVGTGVIPVVAEVPVAEGTGVAAGAWPVGADPTQPAARPAAKSIQHAQIRIKKGFLIVSFTI